MKTPSEITVFSGSYDETIKIASLLSSFLLPGDVICLDGDLGAGKTAFTAGIAQGLGIRDAVSSPTFTILHQYKNDGIINRLNHFDAYRLSGAEEFIGLGFEEITDSEDSVSVIEWAERLGEIFDNSAIKIKLKNDNDKIDEIAESKRKIIFKFPEYDKRASEFIGKLKDADHRIKLQLS